MRTRRKQIQFSHMWPTKQSHLEHRRRGIGHIPAHPPPDALERDEGIYSAETTRGRDSDTGFKVQL